MTFAVIKFSDNKQLQVFCENRKCKNEKAYNVYSWEHLRDIGWKFERADFDDGGKLGGMNKELKDDGGRIISLYCPECTEQERKQ